MEKYESNSFVSMWFRFKRNLLLYRIYMGNYLNNNTKETNNNILDFQLKEKK